MLLTSRKQVDPQRCAHAGKSMQGVGGRQGVLNGVGLGRTGDGVGGRGW